MPAKRRNPGNRVGNPNPKTDHLKPTQFKPGQSGNPSGRPRKVKEAEGMLEDALITAVTKIVNRLDAEDEKAAYEAALQVLDRVLGKPKQTVESTVIDKRDVTDLSDAELADIATTGRAGTSAPSSGESESDRIH